MISVLIDIVEAALNFPFFEPDLENDRDAKEQHVETFFTVSTSVSDIFVQKITEKIRARGQN